MTLPPVLSPNSELSHRSPWRILWNCVAMRQDSRGPTRPSLTKGSATPPIHTSMLSGVPYKSNSLRARSVLFRTRPSSPWLLGWDKPQNLRQALYPGSHREDTSWVKKETSERACDGGRRRAEQGFYLAKRGHAPSACSESPNPEPHAAQTGTASPSEHPPTCGLVCSV